MIIFNLAELKIMRHKVMKHSVNLNRRKNGQWNTHLNNNVKLRKSQKSKVATTLNKIGTHTVRYVFPCFSNFAHHVAFTTKHSKWEKLAQDCWNFAYT